MVFRDGGDVISEVAELYAAGVRHLRLGQQTCFFSYSNRDPAAIEDLLAGIRQACPDLEVPHIDNADPLAVASNTGARIARLVARYCTEGNCAPMGIESFDPTRHLAPAARLVSDPDRRTRHDPSTVRDRRHGGHRSRAPLHLRRTQ